MPGVIQRSPVKPALVGKRSQIPCLQDQVNALSRFFLPASTQLEAKLNIAMKIRKYSNIYVCSLLFFNCSDILYPWLLRLGERFYPISSF
jgi:hypothetical protein